jgi:hypothetical protein
MAKRGQRSGRAALALAVALGLAAGAARAAEPPEPVALAGPVATAEGELEPLDVDSYVIDVSAGEQLFVALFDERDGAFTDTRLSVSLGGAVLALDDDGGDGFLSRIALEASAGGSYEIRVSGFRDADFDGSHAEGAAQPAPYRLVVGVGAPPLPAESEPNDLVGDADALPAGGALVRGTLGALDVDRYTAPVASGDSIAVSLFPLDAATGSPLPSAELGDTRLGLFHAGALFAEDDDGGPGLFSNLARSAPAGASQVGIAVTGFRDSGYQGVHPEGPFDYVLLVASFEAGAGAQVCDAAAPLGTIDEADVAAIFAARNTPASGPDDPRDADHDGTITVLDASQCRLCIGTPTCPPPPPACGLLGIEPLGVLVLLAAARRRRSRRTAPEAEVSR